MRFIVILMLALLVTSARAATTNTAASVSYANVLSAYNLCNDGDTLAIPAGSATWSQRLTVQKGIRIMGAGTNATHITRAGQAFSIQNVFHPKAFRLDHLRITQNTFDGSGNYPVEILTSTANTNNPLYNCRIDHNLFDLGQYTVTFVGINSWGVIDHNTFLNCDNGIQFNGGSFVWQYPIVPSTTNCIVAEDNRFICTQGGLGGMNESIMSGQGVRFVVRYNSFDGTAYTTGNDYLPYEHHGKGGSLSSPPTSGQLRGPPIYEIYKNTMAVNQSQRFLHIRGGSGLIWSNVLTSVLSSGSKLEFTEDDTTGDTSWSGQDQIENTFAWGNTYNGVLITNVDYADANDPTFIQKDRDFFLHPPDNTSGKITWSDWPGSHNATFNAGVTQTYYPYTPLVYPHPLVTAQDGGGAPDTTAPTLASATIPAAGATINLAFDEAVTYGSGGNGGWTFTMSGGAVTAAYSSGAGTATLVYSLSRTISPGETKTAGLDYTQPGNGIEDTSGNDLATISGSAIVNNAASTNFYVAKTGNDSNAGTEASPWLTIGKANSTLTSGQQVFIKAGSYNQAISPSANGGVTTPIAYNNYASDAVVITGNFAGINLTGKTYITVNGLTFTNVAQFGSFSSCTNNTVTNCTFHHQQGSANWGGFAIADSSQSNKVVNNTMHHWGSTSPASTGDMIDIGGNSATDFSYYNRIEGNTLYSAGHSCLNLRCGYNIVRGNWMHNEAWSGGFGHRCMISDADPALPGGFSLIESNKFSFADHSVDGGANAGLDLRTRFNIVRRNQFYNSTEAGLLMAGGGSQVDQAIYNHIYNNTFYTNGLDPAWSQAAIGFQTFGAPFIVKTNSIFNNIMRGHTVTYWNSGANAALAMQIRSNNWEEAGNPLFTDVLSSYTAFSNTLPVLVLLAGSPCIDNGGWLTTITSSSGSGTSFNVGDAAFFQAGMGDVRGDLIQLQGQLGSVRITGITGNAVTVGMSVTWTNGQGISLPFTGAKPDQGAFEFPAPESQRNLGRPSNLSLRSHR